MPRPIGSARNGPPVSRDPATGRPADRALGLHVKSGPETDLGPVQQNAKVIPIHPKFPADLVFLLFFQEESAKHLAVSRFQFGQDVSHLMLGLLGDQRALQVCDLVAEHGLILLNGQIAEPLPGVFA